jgi:hypothetical protein
MRRTGSSLAEAEGDTQREVVRGLLQRRHLALYLALGWSQCTSTWRWPDSSRWRELLGGPPPLHWLPRVQWHLCWLTADPESVAHLTGLDEALEAGHADPELREVAVALRSFVARQAHEPGAGGAT